MIYLAVPFEYFNCGSLHSGDTLISLVVVEQTSNKELNEDEQEGSKRDDVRLSVMIQSPKVVVHGTDPEPSRRQ